MIRLTAGIASALFISACGSTETRSLDAQSGPMNPNARVYVAVPDDGQYGSQVYVGSGQMVARAAQVALQRRVGRVDRGETREDTDSALASARSKGADLMVLPVIARWEDRATEWSGLPDRVAVLLTVFDARTGAMMSRGEVIGRSSLFTFGGDRPQDLLAEPMNAYAASLF